MKVIEPSVIVTILAAPNSIMQHIEDTARTCYKSNDKATKSSYADFIRRLIKRGHEAMLEHGQFTVNFVVDRGVSHELVRHRIASFAQESTRYCNYGNKEIEFVRPVFYDDIADSTPEALSKKTALGTATGKDHRLLNWYNSCLAAECAYKNILSEGGSPQEARSVLPNALATELVVTANLREWRTILKLRCAKDAHPDMRRVMLMLLHDVNKLFPPVFEDIYEQYKDEVDALGRQSYFVAPDYVPDGQEQETELAAAA